MYAIQNNGAFTVANIATNSQLLKFTVQGTSTGDTFLTDHQIIQFKVDQ
jgi:hypothetical protein